MDGKLQQDTARTLGLPENIVGTTLVINRRRLTVKALDSNPAAVNSVELECPKSGLLFYLRPDELLNWIRSR